MTAPTDNNWLPEVRETLGRLVLIFQLIERQLKALLAMSYREIPVSKAMPDGAALMQEWQRPWQKETMGNLLKHLFSSFLRIEGDEEQSAASGRTDAITLRLSITLQRSYYEDIQRRLKDLVASRNLVIHEFYDHYSFQDEASTLATLTSLKQIFAQSEAIRVELSSIAKNMDECQLEVANFMNSPEYAEELKRDQRKDLMINHPVIALLIPLFFTKKNPAEWFPSQHCHAYLRNAGLTDFQQRCVADGSSGLREFLGKSELFEFREVATPKGKREEVRLNQNDVDKETFDELRQLFDSPANILSHQRNILEKINYPIK